MEILRVLNNNVVVALNDEQKEIVLMGSGLGFQKKAGSIVDPQKIEKTFEMKTPAEFRQVEQLLLEIPEAVSKTAYDILTYVKKKLNREFTETSFLSFADHLYTAIQRIEKGIQIKNFLLWDIERLFPEELAIAHKGIAFINEQLGVQLSDDEAGFLTLHIVNAEVDTSSEYAVNLTQLVEEVLTVIKYTLHIDFSDKDLYFQRFITHLRFFAQRVLDVTHEKAEENAVEQELFGLISQKYPEAFAATKKVVDFLAARQNYSMSKDEQVYLTIHIARIIEKTK